MGGRGSPPQNASPLGISAGTPNTPSTLVNTTTSASVLLHVQARFQNRSKIRIMIVTDYRRAGLPGEQRPGGRRGRIPIIIAIRVDGCA
jgi:hypothetical protein